jgi:hypothetical protein
MGQDESCKLHVKTLEQGTSNFGLAIMAQCCTPGPEAHSTPPLHQENRKALVGLATRPNQSQTRANKTRPD